MVTSHNMAASHGNSGPSSVFFLFFPLLLGVTTWKLKIRFKVRKLLKSERKHEAKETDWRGGITGKRRRWRQKREGRESDDGAPAGRKRFGEAEELK